MNEYAKISDITDYIPYDPRWFRDGLAEVDFCTTDRCVKNDQNRYLPVWLPDGSTIKGEVIKMISERIKITEPEQIAEPVEQLYAPDLDDSDDDFGPNFDAMSELPNAMAPGNAQGTAIEQATRAMSDYMRHAKGYVPHTYFEKQRIIRTQFEAENSAANKAANKALKKRYDEDPRVFWNQDSIKSEFPEFLVSFSIFIFSLLSSSANCERTFSRMG